MSWVDLLVVVWIALGALVGFHRGFTAQLLSLAGLALGAWAGARLGPLLLSGGGDSPWVPLASLIGAIVGALLLQTGAVLAGGAVRGRLDRGPLRLADASGGVVLGAAVGLAVAWLAAVAALQLEGSGLRRTVRDSAILSGLVDAVSPATVLQTLARIDPLPLIAAAPDLRLPPPDGSVLESRVTRSVAPSVVKIESVACGAGLQGSGWVVRRGLVATNAHVVAGGKDLRVLAPGGQAVPATPVYVDAANDVALLLTPGLRARSLEVSEEPVSREEVALLGYPSDGPLTARAGTVGPPTKLLAPDAYGRRVRLRTVVPLRGSVERGDSGGPVVNDEGEVVAMMFAAAKRGKGGFGVPTDEVLRGLNSPLEAVSTGPCPA